MEYVTFVRCILAGTREGPLPGCRVAVSRCQTPRWSRTAGKVPGNTEVPEVSLWSPQLLAGAGAGVKLQGEMSWK